MFDSELFCKLWEVFPDSFSITKQSTTRPIINGRFGQEYGEPETATVNLADCILSTAQAIKLKYGDRAIKYIEQFSDPKGQRKDILAFNFKEATDA